MADEDRAGDIAVDWVKCAKSDCIGARLRGRDRCWAHVNSNELEQALRTFAEDGLLDARGVVFTEERLRTVLSHAPRRVGNRPVVQGADFTRCTFPKGTSFDGTTFAGDVHFDGAVLPQVSFRRVRFEGVAGFASAEIGNNSSFDSVEVAGPTSFMEARFGHYVSFTEATFAGDAIFHGTSFGMAPHFDEARFARHASFFEAAFGDNAAFVRTRFEGTVDLKRAVFTGGAHFTDSVFSQAADFRAATFDGPALLAGATFGREADFTGARLNGRTDLEKIICHGVARFEGATFGDRVSFEGAELVGSARFDGARFEGTASFRSTRFEAPYEGGTAASFQDAVFRDVSAFSRSRVRGNISFLNSRFADHFRYVDGDIRGDLMATRATFGGQVNLAGTRCDGEVSFTGSRLERAQELGPLLATGRIQIDRTVWHERVTVQLSTPRVSCRWARFLSGVVLTVRSEPKGDPADDDGVPEDDDGPSDGDGSDPPVQWPAEIDLDDADFAAASIVGVAGALPELGLEADGAMPRPQLTSLERANVAGLTLSGLNLSRCQFDRAHNLDKLRMDDVGFGQVMIIRPVRWVIEEERAWRALHASWWAAWRWGPAPQKQDLPPLHATQVAGIYRDLRKGSEDRGDEPGAADFYYGEMEMRRHATSRRHRATAARSSAASAGEHAILTLYWLLSGYGLRAWRALTAFALAVGMSGVAFAAWGFDATPSDPLVEAGGLSSGLLTSARAATAVLSSPDVALTTFGSWLHVVLRLIGPVLLGLAVLSIRGRVKR